nr:unnamed protein product [Haemonchus contortus]
MSSDENEKEFKTPMAKRMYGQLYEEGKQSRLAAAFLSGADDETKRLCRTFMDANSEIHLKAPANKSSMPSEPSCPVGSCDCGSYGSPVKLRWNLRACSGRPLSDVYSHELNSSAGFTDRPVYHH